MFLIKSVKKSRFCLPITTIECQLCNHTQVFPSQFMRFLYPIAKAFQPKYILDAGANAGFATMLFKLLWPESVVLALEPGDENFKVLEMNSAR